jgi:hypothetical protein
MGVIMVLPTLIMALLDLWSGANECNNATTNFNNGTA